MRTPPFDSDAFVWHRSARKRRSRGFIEPPRWRRKTRTTWQALAKACAVSTLQPELPDASFYLALTLEDLDQSEAALTCFVRAADVAPERYEVQHRLALALARAGQLDRAVPHYQAALALKPQELETLVELSAALRGLKRSDGAVAMARRAVTASPHSARAHYELAQALYSHERVPDLGQALVHYREATQRDPRSAEAHFGLACALVDVGALSEGLEHFRTVLRLDGQHLAAASNVAYLTVFDPESTAESALSAARNCDRTHGLPLSSRAAPPRRERSPERRLRVGFVGVFQGHAQSFFLAPLFAHHDRTQLELYGYAINARRDGTSALLREHLRELRDISGLTDGEAAALIQNDAIDVLIDFNMHMAGTRLRVFAEKPAPVQMCWLAYPGTTGLSAMDYRITDPIMDPEGAPFSLYSERSLRLPDAFWCFDPLTETPNVSDLPAHKNGYVTFGSFNAFWKTNPALFELWASVLHAIPESRFVLLTPGAEAERRAREAFAKSGITASRLAFVPRRDRPEYLAGHAAIDIALDTLPYSGHTTTLDALWMGVPVVTLVGETAAGRAGLGVMHSVGLPELVANTPKEFVACAQRLSADLPALSALRGALRDKLRGSVAMDGARFAKHFEAALRGAWREWCSSGPQ